PAGRHALRGGRRPPRQLRLGALLRRDLVEEGDERPETGTHVPGPADRLVAGPEQLVGDVERGERERLHRVPDARALELRHAPLHELRELAEVVGRGLGGVRQRLDDERQLDAQRLTHSGLYSLSLPTLFILASTSGR